MRAPYIGDAGPEVFAYPVSATGGEAGTETTAGSGPLAEASPPIRKVLRRASEVS